MVRRTANRVLQPQTPKLDFNHTANFANYQSWQLLLTTMLPNAFSG